MDIPNEFVQNNDSNGEDEIHSSPEVAPPISEEETLKIREEVMHIKEEANTLFKQGDYVSAINKYTICIGLAEKIKFNDQLHILYCNRGLSFSKVNDLDKAIESFSKSLEKKSNFEKALYNRMMTLKAKGEYIDAAADMEKVQLINNKLITYSFEYELKNLAEKKKQQMTQEMMGQLKDVGNKFLGLFGLSTDNFKVNQSDGGGYNISFQQ